MDRFKPAGLSRLIRTIPKAAPLSNGATWTNSLADISRRCFGRIRETLKDELSDAHGFDNLAGDTLRTILLDCDGFQQQNRRDIELACAYAWRCDYTVARAGHDFWLTRNGHGVGFWDRGLGAVGDALSKAAQAYGERNVYLGDDGAIYLT
jgi:hypothetical protein